MKIGTFVLTGMMAALLVLGACKKDEPDTAVDYTQIDNKIITDYISSHNLNADSLTSGLYYVINKVGTGKSPSLYSDIKIRYKGTLVSGSVFDEASSAIILNLSQVIEGWQQGIPNFKEGGEGILLIPSHLGYGNRATGSIPANSVLIFEIKLDEVF